MPLHYSDVFLYFFEKGDLKSTHNFCRGCVHFYALLRSFPDSSCE